ncbi:hypothetical protein V8G54_007271, partial [Vigna mungo]
MPHILTKFLIFTYNTYTQPSTYTVLAPFPSFQDVQALLKLLSRYWYTIRPQQNLPQSFILSTISKKIGNIVLVRLGNNISEIPTKMYSLQTSNEANFFCFFNIKSYITC